MRVCVKCQAQFDIKRCPVCAKRYMEKYKASHPEKLAASISASLVRNREERLLRRKKYREENAALIAARAKIYRDTNKELVREANENYRARKINAGRLSKGISLKLYKLQKGKCACCKLPLGEDYHMDHIMPLVLGGKNTDDNIQLLRSKCNMQKNAKHPVDFMQQRGFLL